MRAVHPPAKLVASLAALAVAVAMPAASLGGNSLPQAEASKSCHLSRHDERHSGPTYLLKLSVFRTRCKNGKKVVKGYYKCRKNNGGRRGHCKKRVFGYKCSEKRFNELPKTQFDARVTCKKGRRKIKHTYEQFL
jgi:hypothetical protein